VSGGNEAAIGPLALRLTASLARLMPGDPANGAIGRNSGNVVTPIGTFLNLPHGVFVGSPANIPATGTAVSFPIPNSNSNPLIGLKLYFQAAELETGAFSLSNGLSWNVGR
jgi:hypothetical protein